MNTSPHLIHQLATAPLNSSRWLFFSFRASHTNHYNTEPVKACWCNNTGEAQLAVGPFVSDAGQQITPTWRNSNDFEECSVTFKQEATRSGKLKAVTCFSPIRWIIMEHKIRTTKNKINGPEQLVLQSLFVTPVKTLHSKDPCKNEAKFLWVKTVTGVCSPDTPLPGVNTPTSLRSYPIPVTDTFIQTCSILVGW